MGGAQPSPRSQILSRTIQILTLREGCVVVCRQHHCPRNHCDLDSSKLLRDLIESLSLAELYLSALQQAVSK